MLEDYDFHPDEATSRLFRIPDAGVLRLDDEVAVYQVAYEAGVVLHHYAFGDRWYKVNVTTDLSGNLIETGDANQRFAFNCDLATPMTRDGMKLFAVDLFLDLLIREDASTVVVADEDELDAAVERGLVSAAEARAARAGIADLLDIIQRRRFLAWLESFVPFEVCDPPRAQEMLREETPARLRPEGRATW